YPRAYERGIELVLLVEPAVPDRLIGDGARVRQVLTNLVVNALKYTERGWIRVEVGLAVEERDGVLLEFRVRDAGVGIPEGRPEPFEPFGGADGRRAGGTRLGLAISSQLAALMGGSLEFHSESGKGSTFTFRARMTRVAVEASPAPFDFLVGRRVLLVDASE